ncbi:hypothetical protein [Sphingopyxis flava]|uniref:hypothetical protein n=1 Tax=Sphingopyxis flava TaxID=1507287 RepID=UPI00111658C2|nr:hypothetical protein [Sphingopyxis flava]
MQDELQPAKGHCNADDGKNNCVEAQQCLCPARRVVVYACLVSHHWFALNGDVLGGPIEGVACAI